MGDQEDIMLTFRQKLQLNNNEHMFFRQEVNSWRDEMQNQQNGPTNLEDICCIESSEDEECGDPGDELLKKGNKFLEKGEWARAISMYTSAISKKRTAKYYTARALAYLKRCNLVEAEKDCTEAIHLDPEFTKAYIRRALARKLLGKCKESCDDMEMILKLDPENDIVAMEYEAILDYLQKNFPCVEDSSVKQDKIETALKLKRLGNDFVSKCQYKKAIVKFTSAIELNPNDPTFYANRAICHMKLKDFVSAEMDCCSALKLDGKYAKVYLRRARVRKCLGKLYQSRQDFYSTFELTRDEKVKEELEEVERSIRQIETQRRNNGAELENHNVFSILETEDSREPKLVQLEDKTVKNKHLENSGDFLKNDKLKNGDAFSPNSPENGHANGLKSDQGLPIDVSKETRGSISQSRMNQINTDISIPVVEAENDGQLSSTYDIREVFSMTRDDPAVKFTGPYIRVIIKDGKFSAPEKLLEIPDDLMRHLLPR